MRLICLDASNCEQLQSLPELPSCLGVLDTSVLQTLYNHSRGSILADLQFKFDNCLKLNEKANKSIQEDLQQRIQHLAIASLRLFYEKAHNSLSLALYLLNYI